ncbi:Gpi1-domain-containing protein [Heliocybe sulcata]|uniref:Gpi1-domain-containing protein n=1 Tax=Heliocybe sulcata TaxID=5364 RepID=A0A5C3N781_9AGAM|nr:Gpi1-domain-containing protein [Heliocybe sulcata]
MHSTEVTHILWPIDVRRTGFIYGWTSPALCVAGVLDVETREEVERYIQSLASSEHGGHVRTTCSGDPIVLGRCSSYRTQPSAKMPVPSLEIEATRIPTSSQYLLIYYRRPKSGSLHYYTLGLGNRTAVADHLKPLKLAVDVTGRPRAAGSVQGLNEVGLNQMNYAHIVEVNLSATVPGSSSGTYGRVKSNWLFRGMALHFGVSLQSKQLKLPGACMFTSTWRFMKWISMTVQQCNTRAEQFSHLPFQLRAIHHHPGVPVEDYVAIYNTFYNFIWLVLNDVIIGTAIGAFICDNHVLLAVYLGNFVEHYLVGSIQDILIWLDNWPAGLKLNTELSNFYCSSFIGVIALWGQLLRFVIPHLPTLIYAVGAMGSCGVTMVVSSMLDLLNIFTVHLHVCYYVGAAVYRQQLRTLGSLWNLFRGKRFNVLRHRIDNWDYDIDQLLLGTILFTLVAFLFPTVLTYYSLFAALQFCVILIRASLETLLVFMNHFPLFALMLRVKDPWRLPGGIYFEFLPASDSSPPAMAIQNKPVPFVTVFSQFVRIWSRIASHYSPLRLLRCLVTGDYLTSIPGYSIRHGGLPERDAAKNI